MSGSFCNVIKVHLWGSMCPNFIPSYGVNSRQVTWAKQGYPVWPFTTVAQSKAVREENSQEKTLPSPKVALKHILRPFAPSDFPCSIFSCMLGTLGPSVFWFGIHLFPVLLNSGLAAHCSKANTWEISVRKTLFWRPATKELGGLMSKNQLPIATQAACVRSDV